MTQSQPLTVCIPGWRKNAKLSCIHGKMQHYCQKSMTAFRGFTLSVAQLQDQIKVPHFQRDALISEVEGRFVLWEYQGGMIKTPHQLDLSFMLAMLLSYVLLHVLMISCTQHMFAQTLPPSPMHSIHEVTPRCTSFIRSSTACEGGHRYLQQYDPWSKTSYLQFGDFPFQCIVNQQVAVVHELAQFSLPGAGQVEAVVQRIQCQLLKGEECVRYK